MNGKSSTPCDCSAMHACVNKALACCRKVLLLPQALNVNATCILMPPLCQEGPASPIFQRRLRRFPHSFFSNLTISTILVP
eukprot:1141013-Pelagomonas_calceolata.AAC.4